MLNARSKVEEVSKSRKAKAQIMIIHVYEYSHQFYFLYLFIKKTIQIFICPNIYNINQVKKNHFHTP